MSAKSDRVAIAEGKRRAEHYRATAPLCLVCRQQVATRGRKVHFSCDPDYPLAGAVCICPPNCTKHRVGDGPRECAAGCAVCSRFRGQLYADVFRVR